MDIQSHKNMYKGCSKRVKENLKSKFSVSENEKFRNLNYDRISCFIIPNTVNSFALPPNHP